MKSDRHLVRIILTLMEEMTSAHDMKEIRMCRDAEVTALTDGGWPEGELWALDTPARRRELELIVKVGNRLHGDGSHWIEERKA